MYIITIQRLLALSILLISQGCGFDGDSKSKSIAHIRAQQLNNAWNSNDSSIIDSIFTDESVYIGTDGTSYSGREGAKKYVGHIHVFASDVKIETKSIFAMGDVAVSEWLFSGRQTSPVGPVRVATGKEFSVRGVTIIELEGTKIKRAVDYIDLGAFLGQLGVGFELGETDSLQSDSDGGIKSKKPLATNNAVKYTRLYSDSKGESHFEDMEAKLSLVEFAPPAPPVYLSEFTQTTQFGYLRVPAGLFGDWHPTPKRQIFFYLSGEIEAETSDGEVRRFGPGSITLVEDTSGRGHTSRVVGTEDVLLAVVQLKD